MKKTLLLLIILIALNNQACAKNKQLESWYVKKFCTGQVEYRLPDATRVDCLTADYAIEFDFAKKWAECVGQSLYYADMTGKKPACFLIIEDINRDQKYLQRLNFIAKKHNIFIISNQ